MKKILFLAIALVMSVCGAWAAALPEGTYTIKVYSTGKYLAPTSDFATSGASKVVYSDVATTWEISAGGTSGTNCFGQTGTNRCLNPWNYDTNSTAPAGSWGATNGGTSHGGDNEWYVEQVEGNVYTIKSRTKGCYLWYNSAQTNLYFTNTNQGDACKFIIESNVKYMAFTGQSTGRGRYLYNDLTQTDGYTLAASSQPNPLTNAYIWRVKVNGTTFSEMKNGQGQVIGMYGRHSDGNFSTDELRYVAHSGTYYLYPENATGMKSGHTLLNQSDGGYKNSQNTPTLTTWNTTGSDGNAANAADNHWAITEVTDMDFYDVVITDGVAAQEFNYSVASYATYSGQNAANGGFFAVAKGTTIANSEVSVTNLPTGKQAVVEVNDHTINITFVVSHSTEEIEALQQKINAALTNIENGVVGYPDKKNADNQSAINTLSSYTTVTASNYDVALAAYAAVCKSTAAVLPTVGKAYKVAFLKADGTKMYVSKKDVTGNVTANAEEAALFVLGNSVAYTGGPGAGFKYILVDQDARFLAANGTRDTYGSKTGFAIVKGAQYTDKSNFASYTNEQNLACFSFVFADLDVASTGGGWYQIGLNADGEISTHYDYWTTTTATTALALEEFDNPNTYKLICRHTGGTASLDGKCVGTFSAPYNVELPSDIKAYVAESRDDLIINLTKLGEGNIVPKNTGVLLYMENGSEDVAPAVAVPAASTYTYEGSNMFQPTMEGVTVDAEVKAYILADAYDHVQFYRLADEERTIARNKAYLELPTSVYSISTFRFDFEDGLTTAISQLSAQNSKHAAFDLAGRRVNAAVKGISIVNGKKFIK